MIRRRPESEGRSQRKLVSSASNLVAVIRCPNANWLKVQAPKLNFLQRDAEARSSYFRAWLILPSGHRQELNLFGIFSISIVVSLVLNARF